MGLSASKSGRAHSHLGGRLTPRTDLFEEAEMTSVSAAKIGVRILGGMYYVLFGTFALLGSLLWLSADGTWKLFCVIGLTGIALTARGAGRGRGGGRGGHSPTFDGVLLVLGGVLGGLGASRL